MSTNLMEKLAISKAIMDKHNNISRNQNPSESYNISQPELQEFQVPNASYNIPQELISESLPQKLQSNQPMTKERILSSRLPDEIKKLMIENPIVPVNPLSPNNSVLSDELVEKATRLMGRPSESKIPEKSKEMRQGIKQNSDNSDLRQMMKEVVEEVLRENGLLMDKSSDTNETIAIKVGQHIFEGKISKIKKTK